MPPVLRPTTQTSRTATTLLSHHLDSAPLVRADGLGALLGVKMHVPCRFHNHNTAMRLIGVRSAVTPCMALSFAVDAPIDTETRHLRLGHSRARGGAASRWADTRSIKRDGTDKRRLRRRYAPPYRLSTRTRRLRATSSRPKIASDARWSPIPGDHRHQYRRWPTPSHYPLGARNHV